MKNRGQSALEYLVTYGWAILAIVIIAGVLWYFGVFNPRSFAGEKSCSGFSNVVCQDFVVNTRGDLTIVLNNKAGGAISGANLTHSNGTAVNCNAVSVAANANTTCNMAVMVPAGSSGAAFDSVTVTFKYIDARSGISHTDSGTVRGKYE